MHGVSLLYSHYQANRRSYFNHWRQRFKKPPLVGKRYRKGHHTPDLQSLCSEWPTKMAPYTNKVCSTRWTTVPANLRWPYLRRWRCCLLFFVGSPIISVPAGHVAVIDLFGNVEANTVPAGVHLKTLFARAHEISLKTQLFEVSQDAPTSEGLMVELDVSVLYHVQVLSTTLI